MSASRKLDSYKSPAVLGGISAASSRKIHHEGLDGTGPVVIKRCKATEPMDATDTVNLRARAPEGVSVDHAALNRANLQELSRMLREHQQEMDELHAKDALEDRGILCSTEIHSHMKNIRMWERLEARQKRDAKLEREFRAKLYLMQRRSFTKGLQNGSWEREHAQDARMMQQTRNLRAATGARKAIALPASGTFGEAMLSTATAKQLMGRMEPTVEGLYVYYTLSILANVTRLAAQSPDRRPRKALAAMDVAFFRGLKSFLDEGNELLTWAVLDLLYQLLTFPEHISELLRHPWDVLEDTGVLGAIRSLVALQNRQAMYFVCRFFASPGWEERISDEALDVLASTASDLVQAFVSTEQNRRSTRSNQSVPGDDGLSANASSASLCLATIAYLANAYCQKKGKSLCGTHLSDEDYSRFAEELVPILKEHGHPNELAAIVSIFGLVSRPRTAEAAARILWKGILQSLVQRFVRKFPPDSQACGKISFSDIFLVRIFTELAGSGCADVFDILAGQKDLHRALCKMYESWMRSASYLPVDERLVVLRGPFWRTPPGKTGRGIVYDLVTDFLPLANKVRRSGSPRRSSPSPLRVRVTQAYLGVTAKEQAGDLALADDPSKPRTESDAPIGWGVSMRPAGDSRQGGSSPLPGHIRAAMGGSNTLEIRNQIGLDVQRATAGLPTFSQAGDKYIGGEDSQRPRIGSTARLVPSFSTRALSAAGKSARPPYGATAARTRGWSHRTNFSAIPDGGASPDSQPSLPPEVTMLVSTNVVSLVYAFFRAIYPALADKDVLIRKTPHKDKSLLSGELEKAKLRASTASLEPLAHQVISSGRSGRRDAGMLEASAASATSPGCTEHPSAIVPCLSLPEPARGASDMSQVASAAPSGTTTFALKLPGREDKRQEEVVLDLDSHDMLLLLSMEAFLLKNSLDAMSPVFGESPVVSAGDDGKSEPLAALEPGRDTATMCPNILEDDLLFLEYGRSLLLKRLDMLHDVGEEVVKEERSVKLNAEADYYTKMLN